MITNMYAIRFKGILFSKLPLTRRIQLPGYLDRKSNQPLGSFTHPCITSESVTKEDYDQAKWIDHFFQQQHRDSVALTEPSVNRKVLNTY